MKKMTIITASVLTSLVLATVVNSNGFEKQKTYNNEFTDVPASEWYASEVKNAYELGLMNGNGDGTFRPDGSISIAEAVALASRTCSIYNNKTIPSAKEEDEWYAPYFDFAAENGIIEEGQFQNPDEPAKRHEVASLFRNALPESFFTKINYVERIIDVSENASYAKDILTLYNAGVVMGSDAYGSFRPESNITRAEAAAIIGRVALPETRLNKALTSYSHYDAYLLDQTSTYESSKLPMASAWLLDSRGSAPFAR